MFWRVTIMGARTALPSVVVSYRGVAIVHGCSSPCGDLQGSTFPDRSGSSMIRDRVAHGRSWVRTFGELVGILGELVEMMSKNVRDGWTPI